MDKDGIKANFLHTIVISLIQSMHQEIMGNIKTHLRKQFLQFLIEGQSNGEEIVECLKFVNMKKVSYLADTVWEKIKKQTKVRSWCKLLPDFESVVFVKKY